MTHDEGQMAIGQAQGTLLAFVLRGLERRKQWVKKRFYSAVKNVPRFNS